MALEKIVFYSKKNCSQCTTTARMMRTNGLADIAGTGLNVIPVEKTVPVQVIKVDEHPEELSILKARGFASVPVVDYYFTDQVVTVVSADPGRIAAVAAKAQL
ncbi:MAG: hypothetical protein EOM68_28530 [Spirochaetia bacterium]|nr:hypothetical protein [Spirochaetia bacterium]